MQQEIKLTNESSNTVFVDDVDVSKGVYYSHGALILFVLKQREEFIMTNVHHDIGGDKGKSLLELIQNSDWRSGTFYTIPDNKRIVTEREVTIDDLKNTDHVGLVDSLDRKGHVVCISGHRSTFTPVTSESDTSFGSWSPINSSGKNQFDSVKDAVLVENCCSLKTKKIYRFATRKELYQWLAE